MTLLDELTLKADAQAAQAEADADEAQAEYNRLVWANDDPQPGDGEALADVLARLGKSAADYSADVDAANAFRKQADRAAQEPELDKARTEAQQAAKRAANKWHAESAKLRAAAEDAQRHADIVDHKWTDARTAASDLPAARQALAARGLTAPTKGFQK